MRRKYVALAASASLVLATAACGTAGAKPGPPAHVQVQHHTFTEHMKLGVLNPGDNADLLAGVATGTFGQAGVVFDDRSPSATGEGKAFFYTTKGALQGTFTLSLRGVGKGVHGYTIATGAGTITSGTQAFKGGTGQFTFKGKSPAGLTYFIITLKGSYTT